MRQRPTWFAVAGVLLTLAAACGPAAAGTAVPDGDQAATYVSAKFQNAMNTLQDTLGRQRDTKARNDSYFRLDERWAHHVISSARLGDPEDKVSRNRSEKNPDEFLDSYTPAQGNVEYLYLGPVYRGLAPTPWVSLPKPDNTLDMPCLFAGVLPACKMADAIAFAFNENKKAARSAQGLPGGKTELTADVPLGAFLKARVQVLPQSMLNTITEGMKKEIIPTKVTIGPDGTLERISMEANINKDGHHVELRETFEFTGKANKEDFPKLPDPSQVTVLPDKAAVNDFWARHEQITGR